MKSTEGRPVVAWARIGSVAGRASAPKSWVAQLGGTQGRLTRVFVKRAASRKTGYEVVCEDPFLMESYFVEDYPLAPGVYEGSSTHTGGPPGYEGRAAFDVLKDGTIEVLGVGPRDRSLPPEVQQTIAERIRAHGGGDGAQQLEERRRERDGEAAVENDQLILKYNFPDLEGSEKQVRWAMDIRRRAFQELARNSENPRLWIDVICAQKSARWWIDNRDRAASELVALRLRMTS